MSARKRWQSNKSDKKVRHATEPGGGKVNEADSFEGGRMPGGPNHDEYRPKEASSAWAPKQRSICNSLDVPASFDVSWLFSEMKEQRQGGIVPEQTPRYTLA